MAERQAGLAILAGHPDDVLAVEAVGKVERSDYEHVLIPAIEAMRARTGKVRLFYVLGDRFEGLSAGAALDDAWLGLVHQHEFARIAVVTDSEWITAGARMFAPLMRVPLRVFAMEEIGLARFWISAGDGDNPREAARRAAADNAATPTEPTLIPDR